MGQGRLYRYIWEPWVSWRASLQQWSWAYHLRQNCELPRSVQPQACPGLPASAWQWCPAGKQPQLNSCESSRSPSDPPFATTGLREEGAALGHLRVTACMVSAGWLQWEGGLERVTVSSMSGMYRGGGGGPLLCFFSIRSQVWEERIWKQTYKIQFLALFNLSSLPFLQIWQHTLIDPATQTPTDKAWGVALWKQVTEDSGHLRPQEQLRVAALVWDSGGFITSAPINHYGPRVFPWMCELCWPTLRGSNEISEKIKPRCLCIFCTQDNIAKETFKKMPANEIRNRPGGSDLQLYLLLWQIQIYLSKQWVDWDLKVKCSLSVQQLWNLFWATSNWTDWH